jgi:phospholipase A2
MKKIYIVICMLFLAFSADIKSFDFTSQAKKIATSVVDTTKNISTYVTDYVNSYIKHTKKLIANYKAECRSQYPVKRKLSKSAMHVRQGHDLCPDELSFIKNRMPHVKQALKKSFDVHDPLKIGLCFSGGGNCAMLVSLGFLLEAENIGLLDAALYTAGSSGSTWTIIPFAYFHAAQKMPLSDFKDQLIGRLEHLMEPAMLEAIAVPVFDSFQIESIKNNLSKRFSYDQHLSSIDIYSAFIGNYTLHPAGEKRLDVAWSSIADTLKKGDMPLPLGSAVALKIDTPTSKDATDDDHRSQYYWFEAGPFEVGSDQLEAYVPTEIFGCKFRKGKPVSGYAGCAPEYPLSFYEGVFGSAFSLSFNELTAAFSKFETVIFKKKISWSLRDLISCETAESTRLSPATFYNYAYKLEDNSICKRETISLYDAIMDFNFPLPILLRSARDLDFIVLCDVDIDLEGLKLAAVYCKRNNIKFPDMSDYTEEMLNKQMTVFNDPRAENYDKEMMTLAYCPFVKNEKYADFDPLESRKSGFCKTLNFNYTKEQAEQVINVTRSNLHSVKDELKAVLKSLEKYKK